MNGAPAPPIRPIDCDVHNAVPSIEVLYPYLEDHWRDYLVERGVTSLEPNYYPRGLPISCLPGARPSSGGPPGSDLDLLREQVLGGVRYAILNCLYSIQSIHNEDWAAAMATALNQWQVEHWLDLDDRLRASIVVPVRSPGRAAEEIERWGDHPGFVQVLLLARSSTPYGKRHHWPIYAAAVRHRLPVGIHAGGVTENPILPVGWPSHYVEDYAGAAQVFQTQLVSLVCEGVFGKFPELRVVLTESGVTWLPALLWRLDKNWKGLRSEVPWVDRPPSEIVREHVRLTVQPFDGPRTAEGVRRVMDHLGSDELLLFSSDYPHWHARDPYESCLRHLSAESQRRVLRENSLATYRLGPETGPDGDGEHG
ncbi:MAG: amidohydrolase family protein [Streptosporangiales bacterium]|nr:amidohydrolase family protein [Streptosporangiales bacterium]